LSKSTLVPKDYINKPDNIFVAMAMGYQLGFSVEQSIQDISVINGRPCLWGDGLLSLCLSHPSCKSITEEPIKEGNLVVGYKCTVVRDGHEPHVKTFTLQEASNAGLLSRSPVWKSYPTRMLQMRARSLALRDKFADALRGLRVAEVEKEDLKIIEGEFIEKKEGIDRPEKKTDLLKEILLNNPSSELIDNVKKTSEVKVSELQMLQIDELIKEKNFDDTRMQKAMDYFDVSEISELTEEKAEVFIKKLDKI
jgi:hypothetical protein